MSAAVCSLSSHFAGCLRPFALRLRTLVDVCGRLLALLALLRMSAAVRSSWPQGVQLSLLQGLRGLPGTGRIQLQKRITGCQIRASNLNFKGSPLSRPGFADVCGRLRSLFALCRMSAAVCSLSSHFAGCLRPFARFGWCRGVRWGWSRVPALPCRGHTLLDVCGRSLALLV